MRRIHIAIRRANAARTRRRLLLSGHGEGSAHVIAGHGTRVSERGATRKRRNDGRRVGGSPVNGKDMK